MSELCAGGAGAGWSLRRLDYHPGEKHRPHVHEWTSLTLILGGALRENVGRLEAWGGALSLVVKPGGTVHSDVFGPQGARTVQLALSPSRLEAFLGRASRLGAWRWLHSARCGKPFFRLLGDLHCGPPESHLSDSDLCEFLAGVLEAEADTMDSAPPRQSEAPSWLRRVRERVEDDFREPPSVRSLATAAGLHPVSLARRFRRHFGMSVSECLKRRRRREAVALLFDSRRPLAEVAYDCGYADQSHLTREVKAATGFPPGALRNLLR